MTTATIAIPARDDFRSPTEEIIRFTAGDELDDDGRIGFFVFWIDDESTAPGGVRGQVFFTNLDRFLTRQAVNGRSVRVLNTDGTPATYRQVTVCPTCSQPVDGLLAECLRTPACRAASRALVAAEIQRDRLEDN